MSSTPVQESFLKPARLEPGVKLAAVSLSSGLAARYPHRYEAGKRQLEETFGLTVVVAPNALRPDEWLHRNPEARADDLDWALTNDEIKGVVSVIGGDDSVRTLPYLEPEVIRRNPKVLLGFSDTTATITSFLRAGVVAFYGPSLMTDLAENGGIHPYTERAMRRALFSPEAFELEPSPEWSEEFLDWGVAGNQTRKRSFRSNRGWRWLQGTGICEGRLVGGCADVLEFLKGTEWWPQGDFWEGAVLCLETSEEVPPPHLVGYWLRNYGMQGVLGRLNGLLLGRPMRYSEEMIGQLHDEVRKILSEFGCQDLPVVANLDFGHTSPQMVLPLGCRLRIDTSAQKLTLLEPAVL